MMRQKAGQDVNFIFTKEIISTSRRNSERFGITANKQDFYDFTNTGSLITFMM